MARQEIQDFGDKIHGAKKDIYRRRGITVDDLDDISFREYVTTITKEFIWPAPDYVQLVQNGMHPTAAYFIRYVREWLQPKLKPTRLENETRHLAELYINFVNMVKSICYEMTDMESINTLYTKLQKYYAEPEHGYWALHEAYITQGLSNEFVKKIQMSGYDIQRLDVERRLQNFPTSFRGDLKGARLITNNATHKVTIRSSTYHQLTEKTFNSIEEAINYAVNFLPAELDGQKRTKKVSDIVTIVRPQLEVIERKGPNLRNNKDASPAQMLKIFQLRGGQFGNWNTQDDRQAYLNYAFDAMVDMAYALGVTLEFMGLDTQE